MSDQKNKQQPTQGHDKDQNKGDKDQNKSGGQQSGGQHGSGQQGNQQHSTSGQAGKQQMPQNTAQQKGNMADTHRQQPVGSEIENPDQDNDPDKKMNIDDDPEQTKKKVPNMHK
jgi:hypothetical protein